MNVRQNGISEYQSCNSLQNSVHAYSIGKEERFNSLYKKSDFNSDYQNLKPTISSRTTTFGYGNKWDISKNVNNYPSPNTYKLPSIGDNFKKGKKILSRFRFNVSINNINNIM
jgi:hypothetical protein